MEIARLWRQQPSNLRLVGGHCPACETYCFPKRVRCEKCGAEKMEEYPFSGGGTVLSMTTVYEAPRGFADQVPYVAGLIQLDEGPVVATMITDSNPEDVTVGMRVTMVTRRIRCDDDDSPILYGYKFAPENMDA